MVNDAVHSADEWQTVARQRKDKPKPTVRVRGVTAIPRKPVLAAFVGQLHLDTTEEQLTEYLKKEGMKGVVCKRLKPKESQKFRTSACYVSCCVESADLFYNEECWPAGVEQINKE